MAACNFSEAFKRKSQVHILFPSEERDKYFVRRMFQVHFLTFWRKVGLGLTAPSAKYIKWRKMRVTQKDRQQK